MGGILIVDDEKDIRDLVSDILEDEGYRTRTAENSARCMAAIEEEPPDLLILDIWLRDSAMDGIDILEHVKGNNPGIPVVIISGHGNIEIAVAAIKRGAYDFIEKPFNIDQLTVVIGRAMEASRLRRENRELRRSETAVPEMIGSSAAFQSLISDLGKVTRTNSRVMLTGPPGSGKELAARHIHARSPLRDGPFVCIACATVDPDSMDVTLFGEEKSGRVVKSGLLERAHGGMIFFDEISDMPMETQSKILRVLVDQPFQRVGGVDKVRVDLRVIASTARDLEDEIAAGRFREELYHRLNVVPIKVPPLESRLDDVPELARRFVEEFHRTQNLPKRRLSVEAEAFLQTLPWPGNVRQLRNVVERALILGPGEGEIGPGELRRREDSASGGDHMVLSGGMVTLPLREAREVFEHEYVTAQQRRFGGNVSRAASFAGISRSAFHRKLRTLGGG